MANENSSMIVRPAAALRGRVRVPGDKSISHRAVMFGALAEGVTHVKAWLAAGDTEASLRCMQALGVRIERLSLNELRIHGTGQLQAAARPLDFVNAGTGIRLMAGIMAGQRFDSVLDGSEQLRRRPMRRIIAPLRLMGASIEGRDDKAPLRISPAALHGITYDMPVASAQVKSSVLLAGLFAEGETAVIQPGPARDHTERMLSAMGVDVQTESDVVTLRPGNAIRAVDFNVPGDFSSAAFLIVAGCIVPGSELTLMGVNLNWTRTGLLDALLAMGADIDVTETGLEAGEAVGEIHIKHNALKGTEISGETVVRMIDEFPVLMVAALHAEGRTVVREAHELRVKETDRLAVMTAELRKLGAEIDETEDGFLIEGPQRLDGAMVEGHDDHRVAMSLAVAGLMASEQTIVHDAMCVGDSFPGFAETLARLGGLLLEDPNLV